MPDTYQIRDLEIGREKQVKAAEIRLKSSIQLLQSYLPECSATYKIINGKPAQGLLKAAETEQIDLIILGSAGKSFTKKLVVGSVSEAVAVQAGCSVEVYKSRKQSSTGNN